MITSRSKRGNREGGRTHSHGVLSTKSGGPSDTRREKMKDGGTLTIMDQPSYMAGKSMSSRDSGSVGTKSFGGRHRTKQGFQRPTDREGAQRASAFSHSTQRLGQAAERRSGPAPALTTERLWEAASGQQPAASTPDPQRRGGLRSRHRGV